MATGMSNEISGSLSGLSILQYLNCYNNLLQHKSRVYGDYATDWPEAYLVPHSVSNAGSLLGWGLNW